MLVGLVTITLLPGLGEAYPDGIGGSQDDIDDVAKEGCLCHGEVASNDVQIILKSVPHTWTSGETYDMTLVIIDGSQLSAGGYSIRVSAGSLSGDGQNWEDDVQTLTHQNSVTREWAVTWTPPESGSGQVDFWITGNAVNGADGNQGDYWNQLVFNLVESETIDNRGTKTLIAGSGAPQAPESAAGHVDLHTMGAPFRAHWLGLLGFGAVISVIVFCGLLLRYGFSTSYKGRSNVLRLRYKINRRGDQ
jgi:hypothetical protein